MEIEREIELEAPVEDVWSALTEAEQLEEWYASDAELEAREGGRARFAWGDGSERTGTVAELAPEERLVLEWDDGGRVELALEPTETGTVVRVRESAPEWSTALALRALAACATR